MWDVLGVGWFWTLERVRDVRGALGEADWVWRIGCGAHRSWPIRRPAAARQSVLSELEPRARTKQLASLLIDLLLRCVSSAGK